MLRKRSCAALKAKERSRRELISRRCSFRTLLTTASCLGLFLAATTRRPLHGRGLAEIRLGSISHPRRASHSNHAALSAEEVGLGGTSRQAAAARGIAGVAEMAPR